MGALRGILAGTLGLAAVQAVLATDAASNLGTLAKVPGDAIRWLLDPSKPLIPDLRGSATWSPLVTSGGGSSTGSGSSSGGGSSSTPTPGLGTLPVVPPASSGTRLVLPPAKLPDTGPSTSYGQIVPPPKAGK